MKRFENAQIGDEVYDEFLGDGYIKKINPCDTYPIVCFFDVGIKEKYKLDGNNTLFYRKNNQKHLINRPEKEINIDWTKVAPGTEVIISGIPGFIDKFSANGIFVGYMPFNQEKPFWIRRSENIDYIAIGYRYCKLA